MPTTAIYTLSLHDALPICALHGFAARQSFVAKPRLPLANHHMRSEEHTSELQSRFDLVCRLLLEKKNQKHFPKFDPKHIAFMVFDFADLISLALEISCQYL